MHQIERGIYYEETYLGVTLGGLVFSQGTILIDAPLRAEDARSWRMLLLNPRSGTNRLLVNLDAHPDRTLGARALDCTVVAHQKTAQIFRNRPSIFKGITAESGAVWESYNDAIGMRWVAPDITFTDKMSLHWGGPEVILEHHPGPTPGSIWVIIPSAKVIFIGDTVVIRQPPFLAHADLPAWLESLDYLRLHYADFTLVSGRGGLASLEDIQAMQAFLDEVNQGIEKISKRSTAPEATQELVAPLMARLSIPPELQERYAQRLRYGLYNFFARRFRPSSLTEHNRTEEEEQ